MARILLPSRILLILFIAHFLLICGAKRFLVIVYLFTDRIQTFVLSLFHNLLVGSFADNRFFQRTAGCGRVIEINQRVFVLNQRRPSVVRFVIALLTTGLL